MIRAKIGVSEFFNRITNFKIRRKTRIVLLPQFPIVLITPPLLICGLRGGAGGIIFECLDTQK